MKDERSRELVAQENSQRGEDAMADTQPECRDIVEALSFAMGRVGYVQKEASRDIKYTFASEAALIRAIRPHLVDLGIIVFPVAMEDLEAEDFESKAGAVIHRQRIRVTWRFAHAPSKTGIEIVTLGEGMDIGDKATPKAMTIALKYALRQALLIETGDDPDYSASETYERATVGARHGRGHLAEKTAPKKPGRPLSPEDLRDALHKKVNNLPPRKTVMSVGERGRIRGAMGDLFTGHEDKTRMVHAMLLCLWDRASSNDLTDNELEAMTAWMELGPYDPNEPYFPPPYVILEAKAAAEAGLPRLEEFEDA